MPAPRSPEYFKKERRSKRDRFEGVLFDIIVLSCMLRLLIFELTPIPGFKVKAPMPLVPSALGGPPTEEMVPGYKVGSHVP